MSEKNMFDSTKGAMLPCTAVSVMGPTTASYFDGLPLTRRHYMMFFLILLGTFFDQMDLYNMSFVGPALLKQKFATMEDLALINSVMVFVMLFGGLFGGYASDRWGRKKSLLAGVFLFSIFSFGNAAAQDMTQFLISRCLTGFGIAMLVCTEAGYMGEVTPSEERGKWFAITFGCSLIASPITGLLAKTVIPMWDWGWRLVLAVGGLGIIIFVLGIFLLRESPRWLVSKGRYEEAKQVFKELSGLELTINPEDTVPQKQASFIETLRCMLSKNYMKASIVIAILLYFFGTAGGFMFTNWAPTLLTKNGMGLEQALEIGFMISFGMPLGGVLAAYISDKGGRKIPLGAVVICYGVLALLYGQLSMSNPTLIGIVGIMMAACHMAFFSMASTYGAENYPTYIRGSAFSIIYIFSRLGPTLGNLAVPMVFGALGYSGYFSFVCALLIFAGSSVLLFGRSTAGHNLEDLHKDWTSKMAPDQLNVKSNFSSH